MFVTHGCGLFGFLFCLVVFNRVIALDGNTFYGVLYGYFFLDSNVGHARLWSFWVFVLYGGVVHIALMCVCGRRGFCECFIFSGI